jgi:hypothetical protein
MLEGSSMKVESDMVCLLFLLSFRPFAELKSKKERETNEHDRKKAKSQGLIEIVSLGTPLIQANKQW